MINKLHSKKPFKFTSSICKSRRMKLPQVCLGNYLKARNRLMKRLQSSAIEPIEVVVSKRTINYLYSAPKTKVFGIARREKVAGKVIKPIQTIFKVA